MSSRVPDREALFLFPLVGRLSGAHRAQPQGPALRNGADPSDQGWRPAATSRNSTRSIRRCGCRRSNCPAAKYLTQSLAIIEYLDEIHPEPPLLPADALERAKVRAIAQMIACDIHPLNNLVALQYLKRTLKQEQPEIDAWYHHWVIEGFTAIEAMIAPGPYTCGAACDARRHLPGAAGVQCAAAEGAARQVPEDRRGRRRLPEAAGLRQGAAGKPAGRGVTPGFRPARRALHAPAHSPIREQTCGHQSISPASSSGWSARCSRFRSWRCRSANWPERLSIFEILVFRSGHRPAGVGDFADRAPRSARACAAAAHGAEFAAQHRALHLAICLGAQPYHAAARHGVRTRIHHAGLDRAARGLDSARADDAEPDRRRRARPHRRAGDPAARYRQLQSGGDARACWPRSATRSP